MEEPQFMAICEVPTSNDKAFVRDQGSKSGNSGDNLNRDEDTNESSDNDESLIPRAKKRVQRFSDSENEVDQDNNNRDAKSTDEKAKSANILMDTDSDSGMDIFKSLNQKSRIKLISNNESESDSSSTEEKSVKNEEQQLRMQNKRLKLNQKFKSLVTSRSKGAEPRNTVNGRQRSPENSDSDSSDSEAGISSISSIEQIKKKIKESTNTLLPSICDPDTSDDDEDEREREMISRDRKRTKLISPQRATLPKQARMSAKQAMENMQKIKSESNRMLREQQVSLPYHRPKALQLKDIMNRRKPAVTADGKALPIKMTNEQLKQYILQLEQRQKEVIQLCKSDSESEEEELDDKSDRMYNTILSNTPKEFEFPAVDTSNLKICEDANLNGDENEINEDNLNNEQINEGPAIVNEDVKENKESEEQASDPSKVLVCNDTNENVGNSEEKAENTNALSITNDHNNDDHEHSEQHNTSTVQESQLISLHLDTEKLDCEFTENDKIGEQNSTINDNNDTEESQVVGKVNDNEFSDDDINMEDIDSIIENAVLLKDDENIDSPMLVRDRISLNEKPRLTGAPGMVIDLDGTDPAAPKKLSGVELLKERFTYFARLKTPEEIERDTKSRIKPGNQHLKLKQELEEKISEQRSLEWAKRLEEEKQQHMELSALRGDASDAEDDIDKIESKLEQEAEVSMEKESSESEVEEEDIIEKPEKPRERNPMIADEAEESDCDQVGEDDLEQDEDDVEDNAEGESEQSSDDESSESETDTAKPKKGRILKAFEDSDDEDATDKTNENAVRVDVRSENTATTEKQVLSEKIYEVGHIIKDSQDDIIQLAQRHVSSSDDLFTSQDSAPMASQVQNDDKDLGTQSFSILVSDTTKQSDLEVQDDKLNAISVTQTIDDTFDDMVRPGEFTQNIMGSQLPIDQGSQSQPLGDDVLALCTGKFYDNQFISLPAENDNGLSQDDFNDDFNDSKELDNDLTEKNEGCQIDALDQTENINKENNEIKKDTNKQSAEEGNILRNILDELDDPEFDTPKPNRFFTGGDESKVNKDIENSQFKKKFIIDSDEETAEGDPSMKKKKKLKKRKAEQRALQISDDEDEDEELDDDDDNDEYLSDVEEDPDRVVEYDSEENEVEISAPKAKKKRKGTDFFEQEAELTSEDEWMGSGDEDEAGLDRMEREAGDDDTFHQGKLQAELGQIHLRDVLDQDKREVRIIQELLFEDGDLGDGHRQRKFRWRNADGEEESGVLPDEFADTREDEFESEEQWRKQRHEREVFLRQMKNQDDLDETPNISLNRTTIIKANLSSKTMSSLLMEMNTSNTENVQEKKIVPEKSMVNDIPSPKKGFPIYKQNYHGSLLTRGRGSLARLAALATPLAAADDDTTPHNSMASTTRRNFVFSALTPDEKPKLSKRKADSNLTTPRLVKKLKTEEKNTYSKNSLLDHLKV